MALSVFDGMMGATGGGDCFGIGAFRGRGDTDRRFERSTAAGFETGLVSRDFDRVIGFAGSGEGSILGDLDLKGLGTTLVVFSFERRAIKAEITLSSSAAKPTIAVMFGKIPNVETCHMLFATSNFVLECQADHPNVQASKVACIRGEKKTY
jgi:hypothetical protein